MHVTCIKVPLKSKWKLQPFDNRTLKCQEMKRKANVIKLTTHYLRQTPWLQLHNIINYEID